jgi:hypothetical protein
VAVTRRLFYVKIKTREFIGLALNHHEYRLLALNNLDEEMVKKEIMMGECT